MSAFLSRWQLLLKSSRSISLKASVIALMALSSLLFTSCGKGGGSSILAVTVAISPASATVAVGQAKGFTATVQNATNSAVTWSVQEAATGGTITAAGAYTAPMKSGSYHIVATSAADLTKSATAVVTVIAPAPAFISTAPALANEGDVYSYSVIATDPADTTVAFSIVSAPDGAAISGSTLTWTPTHLQARSTSAFSIKATTGAGGTATQQFSVSPTGTIRGTAIDTYLAAAGNSNRPEDLSGIYIAALVRIGTTWSSVSGITHSDGTFEIPDVPEGKYWLVLSSGGYWTSASDIDLGIDYLGRPDWVTPKSPSSLQLTFNNLAPWLAGDSIEVFNPNINQSFNLSDFINPGETTTTTLRPWSGPLSDSSRGDAWYATQIHEMDFNGEPFLYLARSTPKMAISQADGGATPLGDAMNDATPSIVHWELFGSQFAALATAMNPNAKPHSTDFDLYVHPFTASKGWIGYAQTLIESTIQTPILTDVDFGDITYGNPFPADWAPFVNLDYEFTVSYTASGAPAAVDVPAEMFLATTKLPSTATPVAPVLGPVTGVKVNGNDLTQPQKVPALSPTLTWNAPSVGAPTGYGVTIYSLSNNGSGSEYADVLDLYTTDTTLTIPPGVLNADAEYFFAIRSYYVPGVDFTTAPYRAKFPWANTDMLTAVVSTQGAISEEIPSEISALQHAIRTKAALTAPVWPRSNSIPAKRGDSITRIISQPDRSHVPLHRQP